MDNKDLNSYIRNFKLPKYTEIPDVGLFLEQTGKFVSEYLAPFSSISITTSMISNYVKKGLIHNPIKKQYYREQIAHVFFIAVAKTVLSLENVQTMITMQEKEYDTQIAYEYFCDEFIKVLQYVFGVTNELPKLDTTNEEKMLLRNALLSVAYKIYLDIFFESKESTDQN